MLNKILSDIVKNNSKVPFVMNILKTLNNFQKIVFSDSIFELSIKHPRRSRHEALANWRSNCMERSGIKQ